MFTLSRMRETLMLDPAGLLIWPSAAIAVVSDLHLGKGSYFAQSGQLLPPYDSSDTLERLHKALNAHKVTTLILLGDSVHDAGAWDRLSDTEIAAFTSLTTRYDTLWILGNHERGFIPDGVMAHMEFNAKPLIFRHEADPSHGVKDGLEISGHYHPKAVLFAGGTKLRRPCFLASENRLILPAFGSFTGGLSATDQALKPYFPSGFSAYLTGDRIVEVPQERLAG